MAIGIFHCMNKSFHTVRAIISAREHLDLLLQLLELIEHLQPSWHSSAWLYGHAMQLFVFAVGCIAIDIYLARLSYNRNQPEASGGS